MNFECTTNKHTDGPKEWYHDGKRHREDGPAVEWPDGTKEWCLNGKLHREDGPAIEWSDGTKEWYLNGELHREDGPAFTTRLGTRRWYLHGELLRDEGPLVDQTWFFKSKEERFELIKSWDSEMPQKSAFSITKKMVP